MTEPSYRLIAPQADRSFVFKWEPFNLDTRWHYHPELELIFFIKGRTSGVVGDGFRYFDEDDLVLLGANVPHVLQENREFARDSPDVKPFGLIVQFTENFLGAGFFQRPELQGINNLIKRSAKGIQFRKQVSVKLKQALLEMHTLSETQKLLSLLSILAQMAETSEFDYLTASSYGLDDNHDEDRLRSINEYVYSKFTEKITIKDIAAVANMTETSFCRYFKTRTLKNFTYFLNEVRISYACRLLSDSKYSVTEVCFESGFNELSYFTRQFKRIMNVSPQQYQKLKSSLG